MGIVNPLYNCNLFNFFLEKPLKELGQSDNPYFIIYQIKQSAHQSTIGLIATSRLEYINRKILRHEETFTSKTQLLINDFIQSGLQRNPVLLFHEAASLMQLLKKRTTRTPDFVFNQTGAIHEFWIVSQSSDILELQLACEMIPVSYIADGHHRIEAMTSLNKLNGYPSQFLSYIVSSDQLQIKSYNRYVRAKELSIEKVLQVLADSFYIKEEQYPPLPLANYQYAIYLQKKWFTLVFKDKLAILNCPSDMTVVNTHLLPKIADMGCQNSIGFLPNIYRLEELQDKVDVGFANAVIIVPALSIPQLCQAINQGVIFPANTSWFEPKINNDLFSYQLDSVPITASHFQ